MVVPADWKEVRLGDLGSTFGGLTGKSSKDFGDGNSSFVTFMNVMSNVVLTKQGTEKVRIGKGERQSQLLEGDVIFNGSSETPEEVGFGSAVPIELSGLYLNSFCFGFRRKDTMSLDPKFFAYLTRSPLGRDIIRPMAQGSTRYNIAKTNLLNGRFPLPPLKEQEAIAEALSDADTAIESLDALIAKKRDVKQAAMQQLLTGRTRLPGFTADWKEVRLGEICEFVKTIALSRSQLEADHGVGCIHYGDIHTKFNDRLDCSNVQLPMAESGMVAGVPRLKVGDLVIADASEDMTGVGKGIEILGIPEYGVVAGLHTAVLRPQVGHFAKGFLGQLQYMPKFKEQARVLASGLKVYGLSKTSISKISVEIPPLKEQEAIAEALNVMDDELEALTEQVSKLRMIKEGMMQSLLTGKVRLV